MGAKWRFEQGNDGLAANVVKGSNVSLSLEACPEATGDSAEQQATVPRQGGCGRDGGKEGQHRREGARTAGCKLRHGGDLHVHVFKWERPAHTQGLPGAPREAGDKALRSQSSRVVAAET